MKHDVIDVYVDGASNGSSDSPGGWACLVLKNEEKIEEKSGFAENTTNNRMELQAAIEGIKLGSNYASKLIKIHSDSMYVVGSIRDSRLIKWHANGWLTSTGKKVANQDLWEEILELISEHPVMFYHVKGHSGNPHNEAVDKLAKAAKISKV